MLQLIQLVFGLVDLPLRLLLDGARLRVGFQLHLDVLQEFSRYNNVSIIALHYGGVSIIESTGLSCIRLLRIVLFRVRQGVVG